MGPNDLLKDRSLEKFFQDNEDQSEDLFQAFKQFDLAQVGYYRGSEIDEISCSEEIAANEEIYSFLRELGTRFPYFSQYFVGDLTQYQKKSKISFPDTVAAVVFPEDGASIWQTCLVNINPDEFSAVVARRLQSFTLIFAQVGIEGVNLEYVLDHLDLAMELIILHEFGHIAEIEYRLSKTGASEADIVTPKEMQERLNEERVECLYEALGDDSGRLFFRIYNSPQERTEIGRHKFLLENSREPSNDEELELFIQNDLKRSELIYKGIPSERFADKFMVFASQEIPSVKAKIQQLKSKRD